MTAAAKSLWVPRIRLLRILWRLLSPLALGTFLVVAVRLLGLPERFRGQASTILAILVAYGLLWGLVWEILAPLKPELRLVSLSDDRARRLATMFKWILLLVLGVELALYLLEANAVHPAFAALIRLARGVGLCLVAWLAIVRGGLLRRFVPDHVESVWDLLATWALRFVLPFGVLSIVAWLVLRALGYLGFAQWVLARAGWTALAVLAVALVHWWARHWLGRIVGFMREADETEAHDDRAEKHRAEGWIALDRTSRLILKVGAALAAVLLVLTIWGIDRAELTALLSHGLPFGSARTWGDLLRGAAQIFLLVLSGGILRDVLVFIVFRSRGTEEGVRYAIVTVLKYVVIVFSVVLAASAVGLNMSAVTVFAGGAGVGLSFALKDILGNFFSGLILLFERPVRVGDLIEVGGVGGKVEAIRLRGTVIRAWDGSAVIIPNQQMVGERLKNLTQERELARLEVAVGVAYDSDLEEVERLLVNEAEVTTGVIETPAPVVRLSAFGESTVDVQLFCYTDRVGERHAIQYALRKNVLAGLTVAGVEMPFPQHDVHLRSGAQSSPSS